jgi:hypothetical protein
VPSANAILSDGNEESGHHETSDHEDRSLEYVTRLFGAALLAFVISATSKPNRRKLLKMLGSFRRRKSWIKEPTRDRTNFCSDGVNHSLHPRRHRAGWTSAESELGGLDAEDHDGGWQPPQRPGQLDRLPYAKPVCGDFTAGGGKRPSLSVDAMDMSWLGGPGLHRVNYENCVVSGQRLDQLRNIRALFQHRDPR